MAVYETFFRDQASKGSRISGSLVGAVGIEQRLLRMLNQRVALQLKTRLAQNGGDGIRGTGKLSYLFPVNSHSCGSILFA